MADDVLVLIALEVGPQVPAAHTVMLWHSPWRFVDGSALVLEAPDPVVLEDDGTGSVRVKPGVWLTDIITPTKTFRQGIVVPFDNDGVVNYGDLEEVEGSAAEGYGPTWAQTSLALSAQALAAVAEVQQLVIVAQAAAAAAAASAGAAAGHGGIGTDTDGRYFYDPTGSASVGLDTDGVPFVIL